MNFDTARFNMIEQQIRPWEVLDPMVLELLSVVKRENFAPPAMRSLAFADLELPLAGASEDALRLGHCMLPPRVEARMLQDLALQPSDSVLEIGAGSGYMAALIAHHAREVVTLEIEPALVAMARDNLHRAAVYNASVKLADGAQPNAQAGVFDAIMLSGSVAQVPKYLLDQLKVGGRLAAVVGDEPMMRMTIITRTSTTDFQTRQPWDTVAPRLQNFPEPSRFSF